MSEHIHKTSSIRRWGMLLIAAPIWWLTGLNVLIYQAAALFFVIPLLYESNYRGKGIYFPFSFFLLVLMTAAYAFSLMVRASEARDLSRVLASLYNLSFWITGCLMMMVLANRFSFKEMTHILKIFLVLGLWMTIFIFFAAVLIFFGVRTFVWTTPLFYLWPSTFQAELIQQTLRIYSFFYDWFASSTFPRISFLAPYPTATGGLVMVILAMLTVRPFAHKKILTTLYVICFMGCMAALLLSLSRMAVLGFLIGTGSAFILRKKRPVFWMLGLIVAAFFLVPFLGQSMEWILNLRKGSNEGRLGIYLASLDQLEGLDWILGLGVKPRNETATIYPIGSHSTYLTLLFKSGAIGLALFILFQGVVLFRWYALKRLVKTTKELSFWGGLGSVFIGMLFWMLTDDLDATQILAFMYFSMVGIMEGFYRELISGRRNDELVI